MRKEQEEQAKIDKSNSKTCLIPQPDKIENLQNAMGIIKVSGTSLYFKIKFENEVMIRQVFPSRRLVIDSQLGRMLKSS